MKKIKDNLKYIKLEDILSIFIFILMIIPSLIFKIILKIKNKKIWLIQEKENTAYDNGYHLFKYIRENYPNDDCYYAINIKSEDYKKVEKYGNIINYGSLKHWLYYMSADKNISTQKSGNPAPALFYILHVWLKLYNNRIFLQHGITYNNSKWLYYNETNFKLFVCGAKQEYEYVKNNFGYPKNNLAYLGFPRFDNLYNNDVNDKQILIMPTWRNWLGRETNSLHKNDLFIESEYYKRWNSLINNKNLIKFIEDNNIKVIFYAHDAMKKYLNDFKATSKNIEIVSNYDIQELLKNSSLLITDYSSIYMDFAYMSKPIIYYPFDFNEFYERQLKEGEFKLYKDAFGKIYTDEDDVVNKIIAYIKMNYKVEKIYKNRSDKFFELKDQNNSKRVYEYIKEL